MNIKEISISELKALAYDQLTLIEQAQNNLKIINQEILERQKSQQVVPEEQTTTEPPKEEEQKETKQRKK
jgi:hypothetical protein